MKQCTQCGENKFDLLRKDNIGRIYNQCWKCFKLKISKSNIRDYKSGKRDRFKQTLKAHIGIKNKIKKYGYLIPIKNRLYGDKNPAKCKNTKEKISNSFYHKSGTWSKHQDKYPGIMTRSNERYKKTLLTRQVNSYHSIPEIKLFKLVSHVYKEAKQNMTIQTIRNYRRPDILLEHLKLIIEYDGSKWHMQESDKQRDLELIKEGFKVLHYRDCLPNKKELIIDINELLSSNKKVKYKYTNIDITSDIH